MPVIHVYGYPRSVEKRRELVRGITEATCKAYEVAPEIVTVYIHDVAKDHAGHAGVLASDDDEG